MMLASFSQSVTMAAIQARKGELWMLHACGVALPDGRVVAFVAPSGGGKSTLVTRLGTEFGYVSDETLGIDPDGRVWPYRKPISLIESPVAAKAQRAPAELGLLPLPEGPLRIAGIVLLDRRTEPVDEPVLEPVELGEALPELAAQSSYLPHLPTPLQTVARLVGMAGGVLRLTYSDVDSVAPLVAGIADHHEELPLAPGVAQESASTPGPCYFRGEVLDELRLTDPDRIAILQSGEGQAMVRVLAGIAPTLWAAASGASFEDLVAAAVAEHGTPPGADPDALVGAAVEEMMGAGALELRHPCWRIRDDVAWTPHGKSFAALPLSAAENPPMMLAGPAALVWGALVGGADAEDDVVSRVAAEAGTDVDTVREDVSGFLRELEAAALVSVG